MIVDANVWVIVAIATDVHHQASLAWLNRRVGAGDELIVPSIVLPEIAGPVSRRTGLADTGLRWARRIAAMPGLRIMAVDDEVSLRATDHAANLRLRGADAVYVAVASILGLPLVSWDDELRARAGRVVRCLTPQAN